MREASMLRLGVFSWERDVGRARYARLASERRRQGCPESSGWCCWRGIKPLRCPQWDEGGSGCRAGMYPWLGAGTGRERAPSGGCGPGAKQRGGGGWS